MRPQSTLPPLTLSRPPDPSPVVPLPPSTALYRRVHALWHACLRHYLVPGLGDEEAERTLVAMERTGALLAHLELTRDVRPLPAAVGRPADR